MKERKTAWLHVRLTPSKAAILRRLADVRYGGNRTKVIDGLIDGSAATQVAAMGKTKSAVSSDKEIHSAFQG